MHVCADLHVVMFGENWNSDGVFSVNIATSTINNFWNKLRVQTKNSILLRD